MRLSSEQRSEAIFGAFDAVVSISGVIFGLLSGSGSSVHTIAKAGLGGVIAAAISMGTGEIEKGDEPWRDRLAVGMTMFIASLVGGLVAILPFFMFSKHVALLVAGVGCFAVATWIGFEKHQGTQGYVRAYLTLVFAAGLALVFVSII